VECPQDPILRRTPEMMLGCSPAPGLQPMAVASSRGSPPVASDAGPGRGEPDDQRLDAARRRRLPLANAAACCLGRGLSAARGSIASTAPAACRCPPRVVPIPPSHLTALRACPCGGAPDVGALQAALGLGEAAGPIRPCWAPARRNEAGCALHACLIGLPAPCLRPALRECARLGRQRHRCDRVIYSLLVALPLKACRSLIHPLLPTAWSWLLLRWTFTQLASSPHPC